jgi:hypothetical protein
MRTRPLRTLLIAALVAAPTMATARGHIGGTGPHVGGTDPHVGSARALPLTLPPVPTTPQYNNPGPQLAIPQPGNSLQQLAPLGSSDSLPASPSP